MEPSDSPPAAWLFKEEPDHYSFADLERDGHVVWDGIANPLARKHLRHVKPGDRVLYYHTGKQRAIVGEMRVIAGPHSDPSGDDPGAVAVEVEPAGRWAAPLTLERIKAAKSLAQWELVRLPRLSVVPISAAQLTQLEKLRRAAEQEAKK